ncbi:MAG: SAM-dependent methyltransferase, partial [Pseudolabrys sp.]
RTVFVATDWRTVLWYSDNPTRMSAVMTSWEGHSVHPRLPMSMANRFIKAGFHFDGAAVFPILNLQFDDDNYSRGLAQIVRNFVAGKNDISADDLKDWHDELERLSEAGRYFFSSNRYIFKASKPSSNA